MPYIPFNGELDAPATGRFVPFTGKLDEDQASAESPGFDALGNQTGSPEPEAPSGALAAEGARLRDTFFSGVDQAIAGGKTVNTVAQANVMLQAKDRLAAMEAAGQGASPEADGLRKTIVHYEARFPSMVEGMTSAQAAAQRGAAMVASPAVQRLNTAKTWGEAWDAFKAAPYEVVSTVTAQSMPSTLPALASAAVVGPGAGAAFMGMNSAAVEAGSSLADYAHDKGVDTTDPKAVQAFFSDRQNLAEALSYAGKRAGIIGALDAASGGMAGKTLAPQLKSKLARQAINMPAQMGAQAALGAAGEAGAQLATKGRIDQPGQVVAEAAGELGGAPAEVVAFSRDAREALRPAASPQATIDNIMLSPTVDEAIRTATIESARPASAEAVENIGRILQQTVPPQSSEPAAPEVIRNESGTLTVKGDPKALTKVLEGAGVTAILPAKNGVVVGKSQVELAERALAEFTGARNGLAVPPEPVRASDPGISLPERIDTARPADAVVPAQAQPVAEVPKVAAEPRVEPRPETAGREPAEVWFGRRGDGYQSILDAEAALPSRERARPDLQWMVHDRNGRYYLAGYEEQPHARDAGHVSADVAGASERGNPEPLVGVADRVGTVPARQAVGGLRAEPAQESGAVPLEPGRRADAVESIPVEGPAAAREVAGPMDAGEQVAAQVKGPRASELPDVTGKPPASWVIREKATGKTVFETYDAAKVDALNTTKYEAVPIHKYLAGVNRVIRAHGEEAANDFTAGKRPDLLETADSPSGKSTITREAGTMFARFDSALKRGDFQIPGRLSHDQAESFVAPLREKWKNGPAIHVTASNAEFPIRVPSDVRGLYYKGEVWVASDAHRDGPQAKRSILSTAAHEAVSHYGLRYMLGQEDWGTLMRQIQLAVKSGNKPLNEIRDYIREHYRNDDGSYAFEKRPLLESDEIAARAVELAIDKDGNFRPGFGMFKAVFAKVAQFLRSIGIDVKFTNAELQGMLVLAMKHLEAGHRAEGARGQVLVGAPAARAEGEGPQAARSDRRTIEVNGERRPIENSAGQPIVPGHEFAKLRNFYRWFGDSKVVDEQGRPLVVYHGTTEDVSAFDPKKTGMRTGNKYGKGAMFFTDRPSTASAYATTTMSGPAKKLEDMHPYDRPNVVPAYLALKNPLELDAKERSWKAVHEQIAAASKQGYDGAIVHNVLDHASVLQALADGPVSVYVAFHPEQIKSAIGNRGTFDANEADIRYARGTTAADEETPRETARTLSPWRDGTGRLQFAPGAWLYDRLGDLAGPMLSKLQMKAASPELRRQLREMKLAVQRAQETAAAVAHEATKLSEDERGMVSDLIEQELRAGVTPPEHAVRLAAMINASMDAQTSELVRLGMLTRESADMWRGKYLPRFYRSKLTEQVSNAWADLFGKQRTMAGIKGKHLKGRGLYETVPEHELAQWEAMGWQVRDPGYQPGLTDDGTVQVWRDFTRAERDRMGEIRDAGFRFVMGYMQTQRDIALGRMFEAFAQNPDMSSRQETEDFSVQVPDGTVPGTGAKRYGKLAGRWVSKDTMSHLSLIEEQQSEAWRMYRKAMALWKEGKTALNPVSHVNNVVSNITMAHFAGVSYLRADKYLAAARDFATKAESIAQARDAGLFLGTMSDAELMNVLPEDLKALVRQQDSVAAKVGSTAFNVMTFWLRRPMGWAYQAEDTFFRYLLWKDATDRGMDSKDAVDWAQKFIFTYDDLPRGARYIRDFGIPFFSYTYKAIPALIETALTHPLRMAAPAAILWAANAAAYAIANDDDDDSWGDKLRKYLSDADYRGKARDREKLEREHLPPWMKGTTSILTPKTVRLGTDELTKLPVFLDMSRMIPGGDLFDVSPNAGGIPLPQPITPSHPLFTTAVAMLGNRDLFFGKDLVDANDTRSDAVVKRADWLWKQISPAIAFGNYHWERGMNAIAQATGHEVRWLPEAVAPDAAATGVGRDGNPVQAKYATMQTFGVKARPIDIDMAEKIEASQRQKMIRDIDAEVRKLSRLNQKGAIPESSFERARDKAQEKKDRLREGLTVDGDAR